MEIKRINTYNDPRFLQNVLNQHGCFLADGIPYEIEIISEREAVVRGENPAAFLPLINQYRFFAPHITRFYDDKGNIIKEYPQADIFELNLEQIQPSQFYVCRFRKNRSNQNLHSSAAGYNHSSNAV